MVVGLQATIKIVFIVAVNRRHRGHGRGQQHFRHFHLYPFRGHPKSRSICLQPPNRALHRGFSTSPNPSVLALRAHTPREIIRESGRGWHPDYVAITSCLPLTSHPTPASVLVAPFRETITGEREHRRNAELRGQPRTRVCVCVCMCVCVRVCVARARARALESRTCDTRWERKAFIIVSGGPVACTSCSFCCHWRRRAETIYCRDHHYYYYCYWCRCRCCLYCHCRTVSDEGWISFSARDFGDSRHQRLLLISCTVTRTVDRQRMRTSPHGRSNATERSRSRIFHLTETSPPPSVPGTALSPVAPALRPRSSIEWQRPATTVPRKVTNSFPM